MGSPGVWGQPSLVAPVCGGNRPALFLLQEPLPRLALGFRPPLLPTASWPCAGQWAGAADPVHPLWESLSGSAGQSTAQVPLATGHQEALQKPALSLPAPAVAPHGTDAGPPMGLACSSSSPAAGLEL